MLAMVYLVNSLLVILLLLQTPAEPVSANGKKLAAFYDGLNVEKLWLAGQHVHWKTGEPTDKPVTDTKPHTHCSAFAAAACQRKGIYLLRPPEHSSQYLANAQSDWLAADGQKQGWAPVTTAWRAQQLANQGQVVVAIFKESDPKRHGHIALVRPSEKSEKLVTKEGPQIIQAGMENYQSTSLKEGFKHHKGAWSQNQIKYFAHEIPAT
jgi:hypothetical protein